MTITNKGGKRLPPFLVYHINVVLRQGLCKGLGAAFAIYSA